MSRPQHQRRRATASPHKQRGVAAIFFGIAIVALVTMLALGFNVGQLFFAKRDLERQAALAALAGAQVASGCRAGGVPGTLNATTLAPGTLSLVNSAVSSSLASNSGGGVVPTASVSVGVIDRNVNPGYNTFVDFTSTPASYPSVDSVRVVLTRPQPAVLAAALFSPAGGATMTASATAKQQATADFSVGTALANVNTAKSPLLNPLLSGLLGTSLSASVVSSSGLAQANISLANLMVAAGVDNLNDLLTSPNTTNISLSSAVGILNTALGLGGASVSSISTSGIPNLTSKVSFSDLLGISAGSVFNPGLSDAVAVLPFVSGADLLTALAEDAAAQSGATPFEVQIPLSVQIPGVIGEYLYVGIISPPTFAFGPVGGPFSSAKNAQLALYLRLQLADPSNLLGLVVSKVASINLALDLTLANGTGTLDQLTCPSSTATNPNPGATVGVTSNLATLRLGTFIPPSKPAFVPISTSTAPMITILSGVAEVDLSGPISTSVGKAINESTIPFAEFTAAANTNADLGNVYTAILDGNNPQNIGTETLLSTSLPGLVSSLISNLKPKLLFGLLPLSINLSGLNPLLTPLLDSTTTGVDALLDPLLSSLGIQVGVVSINMQRVVVDAPLIDSFCSPTSPCPGVPSN